jgi:hypothetical protein
MQVFGIYQNLASVSYPSCQHDPPHSKDLADGPLPSADTNEVCLLAALSKH